MDRGDVLGERYRVGRKLGQGGMGEVYEALDLTTTRRCAVKVIRAQYVADPEVRTRFEQEPRLSWTLDSTYFVVVLDAAVDARTGAPFIVMELLEGEDLEQRVARCGPRPARELVEHLGQVALALTRMHGLGVVHRDLKPSNLFHDVRDEAAPRIKVLDLGIAKVLAESGGYTRPGLGSTPYMAPEQALGGAIGPRVDLYALGLIAYTLLVGTPYARECLLAEVRAPASQRAREQGATVEVPAAFDAWFARAIARDPERRFETALQAVHQLAAALGVEAPAWLPGEPPPPPRRDGEADEGSPTAPSRGDTTAEAAATAAPTGDAVLPAPVAATPPARRARLVIPVIAALGLIPAAWILWPRASAPVAPAPVPPVPLAAAGAVLACPILEVEGAAAEWGWLGAAAGAAVCERARVLLGGRSARTRVPAELLDVDDAPDLDADPYGAADARDRSLRAARTRAQAYVDGRALRTGRTFRVELVLRRPDGGELSRGAGEGVSLPEAVRGAMQPIIDAGAFPPVALDPAVADYSRAPDAATMLRLVDLKLALTNSAGRLEDDCAWLHAEPATDLASFLRYVCRFQLGEPTPTVELPAGTSPGAITARARVEFSSRHTVAPAAVAELTALHQREASAWGRSTIAATLSCLLEKDQPDQAVRWAHQAVAEERKNPTGEWCGPWGQLMSVARTTSARREAAFRWRAWAPWESYAWWFAARSAPADDARALDYVRRASMLAPLDTLIAGDLAERLLSRGAGDEVDAIVRTLDGSPHLVHRLRGALLDVRAAASRTRFAHALDVARPAMRIRADDAGWTRAERLAIAWHAVTIAAVTGEARAVADVAVGDFLDPALPAMTGSFTDEIPQMAAICAHASPAPARACFARLTPTSPGLGGITKATRQLIDGARAYAAGDLAAAARAWRPLVLDAGEHVDLLADAMMRAFAAAGDRELVDLIAARAREDAPLFGGATLVTVQAARLAPTPAEAARLATAVLDAWRQADTRIPVLDEMRRLAQ